MININSIDIKREEKISSFFSPSPSPFEGLEIFLKTSIVYEKLYFDDIDKKNKIFLINFFNYYY